MDALNYEKDSNDDGDDSDMHDETLCTVCLDTMTDADSKKLPCGHQFHTKCITQSFMKQQQPMRQCFYCRTAFEEMPYNKHTGAFVRGLHSNASLQTMLEGSTKSDDIDWSAVNKADAIFYVHRGKNAGHTASFERVTKTHKTATLKLLQDGRKIQCVCHNLSLLS